MGNVKTAREYDEDLPRIEAYGSELNQVWTELIDNALEATRGKNEVRALSEEDHILVEILDDGPGIAPEDQNHVSEPFFTTNDVGEGRGLGLDVDYRTVVERHNGDIRVFSELGEMRLTVRLPLCQDARREG